MVLGLDMFNRLEGSEEMSLMDFVCTILGVDLTLNPELHFYVFAISAVLLIILFSSLYSLLFFIGGISSGKR